MQQSNKLKSQMNNNDYFISKFLSLFFFNPCFISSTIFNYLTQKITFYYSKSSLSTTTKNIHFKYSIRKKNSFFLLFYFIIYFYSLLNFIYLFRDEKFMYAHKIFFLNINW